MGMKVLHRAFFATEELRCLYTGGLAMSVTATVAVAISAVAAAYAVAAAAEQE